MFINRLQHIQFPFYKWHPTDTGGKNFPNRASMLVFFYFYPKSTDYGQGNYKHPVINIQGCRLKDDLQTRE